MQPLSFPLMYEQPRKQTSPSRDEELPSSGNRQAQKESLQQNCSWAGHHKSVRCLIGLPEHTYGWIYRLSPIQELGLKTMAAFRLLSTIATIRRFDQLSIIAMPQLSGSLLWGR